MAELSIQTASGRSRTVRLHRSELLIGRDATCDVILDDPTCSRRHLRIHSPRPGLHVLEDLGSHNGTLVNGEQVRSKPLIHGDEIRAGQSILRFLDRPAAGVATVTLSDEEDTGTVSVYRHQPSLSEARLNQLLELTSRLVGTFDRKSLLEQAMDICIEALSFERGLILELHERRAKWRLPVVRNLRTGGGDDTLTVSRSILNRAIERGERSIINNAAPGAQDVTESMVQHRICSAVCVPITWQDETLGAVYGDRLTVGREYREEDVNFLAGLATQVGAALRTCELVQEVRARQQLENELTVARQIQEGLFPHELPSRADFQIVAFNNPGRNVSGDYYDVIRLDEDRIAMVIADVSGKGVPAAMLMANLQAAVRVALPDAEDLVDVVRRLNRLVCENTRESKFITCLVAVVDLSDRVLRYVNAGHYPPYRTRETDRVESLPPEAGLPLGLDPAADYPLVEVLLGDDDSGLFLFTDGIPESLNEQDEFFGLGRIEELLRRNAAASPSELVTRCRRTIADFVGGLPQSDDVTLLVLRIGRASS